MGKTARMLPTGLTPMLATPGPLPLGDDWAYEVKWDGVRALVAVEGGAVRATSRNRNDITLAYPELQALAGTVSDVLLDGEVVALVDGVPDFGQLQLRMHVRRPVPALVARTPVAFVPFDVLHLRDRALLSLPYDDRRAVLEGLGLQVPPAFHGDGREVLDSTLARGLEGVVAKRRDSPYLPGRRSPAWVKTKHVRRQSAVVCGWKPGQGGRAGQVGSLLLGVHEDGRLRYAGHVGTGFTDQTLQLLAERLALLAREVPPYDEEVPREHAKAARWVVPEIVVDVDFTAWTRDGRLRHPSYKGIRDDLDPREVTREQQSG
ncbi:MAG: non-homologous end-joining DNA ligase [Mycobacteriales bacterium]